MKSRAQAIVEFAIALPVLMLLLYGLLEAGRLLFLYSSVVTASRQAVRYGSASGSGTGGVFRYQDCLGMKNAAQNVAFMGPFDTINISYDTGPGSSPFDTCDGTTDNITLSGNSNRVIVTVSEQFNPIVPRIVPFLTRTITATSARTVLLSVTIKVTPTGGPSKTPTPTRTPTPTPTFTPSPTFTPTLTPLYTYTPSLTPSITNTVPPTLTFTPSSTPTPIATPVPYCNQVSHGLLQRLGNTMRMTIMNNQPWPLTLSDVTVTWNDDKGHQTTGDKTLALTGAYIDTTPFWSGNITGQSTYTIVANPVIPANSTVTIIFTFNQTYDTFDGTELIYINLLTPGCLSNPIQS